MDWTEGVAADVASAVYPDEDWKRPFAFRRPDVEVQAVFAMNERLFAEGGSFAPLHGRGGEAGRVALASPGFAGDGRAKAQRTDGRLGKGHATEMLDLINGLPPQRSARSANDGCVGAGQGFLTAGLPAERCHRGIREKRAARDAEGGWVHCGQSGWMTALHRLLLQLCCGMEPFVKNRPIAMQ